MPTFSDYFFQQSGGPVQVLANTWIQLVSNTSGSTFVSQTATNSFGLTTIFAPPGEYNVNAGPTSTGPWTATGDLHYTVAARLNWFIVTDFGATGNGVTDDSAAIQNALNAANALPIGAGGGGVVYMPPGVYLIGSRLIVPFGVWLQGAGRNATWVIASNAFPTSTEMIRLGDLSGSIGVACRCSDMHIDCNNVSGSIGGYSERINENSGFYRMSINNFASRGIQIKQPAGGATPQHYTIDECEFSTSASTPASAIAIDIANTSLTTPVRRISRISIGGTTPLTTAIKIDGVTGRLEEIHIENMVTGILVGSVLACFGLSIGDIDGLANVTTSLVTISNATTQRSITLWDINPAGAAAALIDQLNTNTITTDVGLYVIGRNSWTFASDGNVVDTFGRLKVGKDFQRSRQLPTEAVLVSGVDATAGENVSVTLSAARLVGVPLNPAIGQRLYFTLIQNGTGGFAVTWNAIFKVTWSDTGNTANKRSTIGFWYDGTNWDQLGAQAPYV